MTASYSMTLRPPGIGCYPDEPMPTSIEDVCWPPRRDASGRNHYATLKFDQVLTFEQQWRFDLAPIDTVEAARYAFWMVADHDQSKADEWLTRYHAQGREWLEQHADHGGLIPIALFLFDVPVQAHTGGPAPNPAGEVSMENALRLIIAKSPAAALEAVRTLKALRAGSTVVQSRYTHTLEQAFSDPEATFTAEDRLILADMIQIQDGTRSFMLRVRLTEAEQVQLAESAGAIGQTLSEYARRRLFDAAD